MNVAGDRGEARASFTVPAGAGAYAPEEIYLKLPESNVPAGLYDLVSQLRILIEALIATAVVEVWILRMGGDPSSAGDWFNSGISQNAAGLSALIEMSSAAGIKLRAKSGGTAGNMPVTVFWG